MIKSAVPNSAFHANPKVHTAAPKAPPLPLRGEGSGVGGRPPEPQDLPTLEHTLWRTDTRHDRALMDQTFAPDFHEFGRSGRRYSRDDLLPNGETHDIDATLHALTVTQISAEVALVTYACELRCPTGPEWSNRASLWDKTSGRWQLRFHQGTPCEAPA